MSTGGSIAESSLKPKSMVGMDFTNSPLTEHVKESAHQAIDDIAVQAAKTENKLRSKVAAYEESLQDDDFLKKYLQTSLVKTERFIQEHPTVSLGLAIAAGYILPRVFKEPL